MAKKKRDEERPCLQYCSVCERRTPHALEVGRGLVCDVCEPTPESEGAGQKERDAKLGALRQQTWWGRQ